MTAVCSIVKMAQKVVKQGEISKKASNIEDTRAKSLGPGSPTHPWVQWYTDSPNNGGLLYIDAPKMQN